MIPDDVRRRAMLAYTEAGQHHAGLNDALAILDAAWPQGDAWLREAVRKLLDEWDSGNDDPIACGEAVEDLRAALAPPQSAAPERLWTAKDIAEYEQRLGIVKEAFARFEAYDPQPAAPGRTAPVRVAVAMDADGDITTWVIKDGAIDETEWGYAAESGYPIRLAILTADLPIPDVPEIAAKVEGV